jgi:hypothetical protein
MAKHISRRSEREYTAVDAAQELHGRTRHGTEMYYMAREDHKVKSYYCHLDRVGQGYYLLPLIVIVMVIVPAEASY